MRVVTLATLGSLPRARALGRSLQAHQPDWPFEIVLLTDEDVAAATGAEESSHGAVTTAEESLPVHSVCDELDVDLPALLALHGEQDLTALLLSPLLRRVAERSGEAVLHLPSGVWILDALAPIETALSAHPVLLVPRSADELPDDGLDPSSSELERVGRIEETIVGIDGSPDSLAFLDWWQERVERTLGSLDARAAGERPEDRPWLARYLELAPARFSTAVLDDPGCNLNMWNLHRHTLVAADAGNAGHADGAGDLGVAGDACVPADAGVTGDAGAGAVLVDGRRPLRFLNLPGFDPDRPHRLSATASRARVSRSPVLHDLCARYAAELRHCGFSDSDHHAEVGRRLGDNLVYDESLRALYSSALALGEPIEDLFGEQGTRAFLAWLAGPAPRGASYGINRYVFHRVAHERPDVVRAYPDLDGPDGEGYLTWCWAFGRAELSIPDRFMPPRPGHAHRSGNAHRPGYSQTTPPAAAQAAITASPAPTDTPPPSASGAAPESQVSADRADPRSRDLSESPAQTTGQAPAGDGPAVRLTGYLGHTLGLGAAARGYVQALGAADVPVRTVSVPLHHLALPVALADEYGRHDFEELVHDGRHGFEIVAVNADELPDFVERLGPDYFQGPRIGIWGWETNTIPARWQRAFALVDEIWVYSSFMAANIAAATNVPVLALPPPVQPPAGEVPPLRLGVPDGFLFLFVFDYLSTIQRKNPVGLIEAFRRAFAPGEGPQLLIKTINAPLRPLAEEEVLWAAHGREDVHVVDRSLSSEELFGLMAACDCYASLHRAEGFGLTMAEAMAIGKPVIATGYSGNVDFMNAHNSLLVDYAIGRVGPECEIYPPEGEWADPLIEHAAELMRRVHDDRDAAAALGARARADIARQLSPAATGAAMRRRLEEISGGSPAHPAGAARATA
ncbi:MAG TPA: glycosyltransferase [Solirubrobacteraceae bacterium]|jgi:glycosyltransferase involved in cell wall biosynthesis